ncbi:MAG: hypothetical protein Fur006_25810 [Coleofasciculaceae cyanobacterium]
MKNKYIRIRTSERRLNKLRLYAASKEKTMTQVIEDFIDSLPIKSLGDSVPTSPHDSVKRSYSDVGASADATQ